MAINPFPTGSPAAGAWTDQFAADVRERGLELWEQNLHSLGMCSEKFSGPTIALFDMALESGAVAMGLALLDHNRLKED